MTTTLTQATRILQVTYSRTGLQGPPGPAGLPGAGLALSGTVAAEEDLPPEAVAGEAWLTEDDGHIWIWRNDDDPLWFDAGPIQANLDSIRGRLDALEANQLPTGVLGDILVHNGTIWAATDTLPTT